MSADVPTMTNRDVSSVMTSTLVVVMVAAANRWNNNEYSNDPEGVSTATAALILSVYILTHADAVGGADTPV